MEQYIILNRGNDNYELAYKCHQGIDDRHQTNIADLWCDSDCADLDYIAGSNPESEYPWSSDTILKRASENWTNINTQNPNFDVSDFLVHSNSLMLSSNVVRFHPVMLFQFLTRFRCLMLSNVVAHSKFMMYSTALVHSTTMMFSIVLVH